ncbi:hypothetical protein HELRODRAFT_177467 [Helobdella robusta]|uniref:Endonuclease/exonuclease/phosphatase domain-containing protein n=1 Tax=Helobdella robusta TaxID=6412 RepID=T1FBQ9_HELRO|nr:hypothetical protein HELRODRAFT_177467 [Helobdella robusta]ESN97831.1 hypothetical protein HELRODRAFT_177467 [Helobdella robusta]
MSLNLLMSSINAALEQLLSRGGTDWTVKSVVPTNGCNKTLPTWMSTGVLSTGRAILAILLRCLFLRTGIEPNPAHCKTYNWHHFNNWTTNINGYYNCNNCRRRRLISHDGLHRHQHHQATTIPTTAFTSQPSKNLSCLKAPKRQSSGITRFTARTEEMVEGSQAIIIKAGGTDINIVNIYILPQSVCPTGFSVSISQFLSIPNVVLLGNVNAHDPLWYSSILASEIKNFCCGTLNLDTPTRLSTSGQPSSPDISVASDTLIINMECFILASSAFININMINNNATSFRKTTFQNHHRQVEC